MKRVLLSLTLAFAMVLTLGISFNAQAEGPKCFSCGSGSSGACKPGWRCYGLRKACQKKGCKVTGYSSTCSTAANVKKCSTMSYFTGAPLPMSYLR